MRMARDCTRGTNAANRSPPPLIGCASKENVMEETTSGGPGAGGADTGDDAGSRFGKAKDYVNEKYSAASDFTRSQYNRAKEKIDDVDFGAITDQVRSYVRSNPGKALLISVGVGFLVGLLLRRDDDCD
jgi:ElaB/YqjD/DUF883 family membrane-anchored ribosome-binding protein